MNEKASLGDKKALKLNEKASVREYKNFKIE